MEKIYLRNHFLNSGQGIELQKTWSKTSRCFLCNFIMQLSDSVEQDRSILLSKIPWRMERNSSLHHSSQKRTPLLDQSANIQQVTLVDIKTMNHVNHVLDIRKPTFQCTDIHLNTGHGFTDIRICSPVLYYHLLIQ